VIGGGSACSLLESRGCLGNHSKQPPEHPKQVLYFTAPLANGLHMHMLYTYATFLFSIQSRVIILKSVAKYTNILLSGEGNYYNGGE
jgi:hypothetical protein